MRVTNFIVLFTICTLVVSTATPAFAANGAAIYQAKCVRLPWLVGSGQSGSGREVHCPECGPDQPSAPPSAPTP